MSTPKEHMSNLLMKADPIKLSEMDAVSLQNRIDRKYILHYDKLENILNQLLDSYRVLEIDQHRVFSYNTQYFDTPDFQFYKDHHNGLINRLKVRCRQYLETKTTFFEIKKKYQGTRTDKYRKPINHFLSTLSEQEYAEINQRSTKHRIEDLDITLENFFYRITLVNKNLTERATIDFGISFKSKIKTAALSNIVIIEVKQGKMDESSPIVQLLKKEKISAGSISKYAYGLLVTGNDIKYNAFKPLLNKIIKIQNHGIFRQPA